jgi:hypothetical protein
MENQERFQEQVKNDAEIWRHEKIKELEEKKDLNETEKTFLEFLKKNDINTQLREIFFEIISIIEYYMDDTPENIMFYALWIIGTYFHDRFTSYPYLFLNAMRGSGKSRLLKLLAYLGNGRYTSNITEPIIFRTKGLICIDELESIGGKDKASLRELLNASYKKGMTIMRVIKKKSVGGDNMEIEEFECYRPVAMANIWGMDEVLSDRCITRVLEKSDNQIKTKLIEDFDKNKAVQNIKNRLFQCRVCMCIDEKIQVHWNAFLYDYYTNYTLPTLTTLTTYYTQLYTEKDIKLYKKIIDTGIFGRNLELLFPIFLIAYEIGDDVLDSTLKIGVGLNDEKKATENQESKDVLVYEFISKQVHSLGHYISVKNLFTEFKLYAEIDEEWINLIWFGKALRRLNLIIDKRRIGRGIEVNLNVIKAKEKLKIFQSTTKL